MVGDYESIVKWMQLLMKIIGVFLRFVGSIGVIDVFVANGNGWEKG